MLQIQNKSIFEREKILMFSLHQNLDVPNGLKALINQKWAWLLFTDLFRDVKIELLRFQVTKPVCSAGGELGCFLSPGLGLGLGFAGALVAAGTLGKTLGGALVVVVVTSLKKSSRLKSEEKKKTTELQSDLL